MRSSLNNRRIRIAVMYAENPKWGHSKTREKAMVSEIVFDPSPLIQKSPSVFKNHKILGIITLCF